MKAGIESEPWTAEREFITTCEGQLFSFKADTDMWTRWHYHPEIDILLILKNTGYTITGDYMGELRPGTLILNGSNVPHAFHANEPDEGDPTKPAMLVIQFSKETLGEDLLSKFEMRGISAFLESTGRSFEFFGKTREKVEGLMTSMMEMSEAQQFAHFVMVLDALASSPESDRNPLVSGGYSPSLSAENVRRVDCVKSWILANLDGKLTLEDAAAQVAMSSKSFSRFFKKNTGKTFIQYVNEIRVGLACRMLLSGEGGVSEICYASGFNNLSHFNRQFKALKGVSPKSFRSDYRAKLAGRG